MRHGYNLLMLIPLLLASGAMLGFVVPEQPPAAGRIMVGVHTLDAKDNILSLARAGGYTWVMQLITWRTVEPVKHEYDWEETDALVRAAEYYRLKLIFRVDHQPAWVRPDLGAAPGETKGFPNAPPREPEVYATFMRTLAGRYKGRVAAYSIWNEPNLGFEWGNEPPNPEEYVTILRSAYAAVKAGDPNALVIAANLAPTNDMNDQALDDRIYLQRMYEAGASSYFDVLGVHPYGFAYPPDDPYGEHNGLNFNRVLDLRQIMVKYGDERKPVWATEFGWTTIAGVDNPYYAWQSVSQEQQAQYLVSAIEKADREWPWMQLMIVWNLSDTLKPDDEKYWFSLLDGNGKPKPAYSAVQTSRKPRRGLLGIQW